MNLPEVVSVEEWQRAREELLTKEKAHTRDGDRTYSTNWRGVEPIGTVWSILDRTPLGRQEEWEDTPEGRPQGPKFDWWQFHDRYEDSG